ncbi:MAG TPA: WG repeat-containing protein [Pyrinomonadaceae bacterium]|nr:WG repeat-containing protein [Pyrinomonadaceae bacterium]
MKQYSLATVTVPVFLILIILLAVPAGLIVMGVSAQTKDPARVLSHPEIKSLPSKEKRWALIIGVNNYGLKGAVNDAKALRNALVKYAGFPDGQVIMLTTDNPDGLPTQHNILVRLDELSRTVPTDGLFLFSFSGHGKTVQDNAYLIPSDGRMTNIDRLLRDFSIDVTRIKEAIEEMRIKQVLMFIDACRDRIEGTSRGSETESLTPVMSRGLNVDEANKDVEAFATLYATHLGESAYEYYDQDTQEWRGYFGKAIEEGLSGKAANEKGEVTLASLVRYLDEFVPMRSYRNEGIRQRPWNISSGYNYADLVLAIAPKTLATTPWLGFKEVATRVTQYEFVGKFSGDLAPVRLKEKWGLIDKTGKLVIPLKYDCAVSVSKGPIPVCVKEKWTFVDERKKELFPPKYDEVYSFSEDVAAVRLNQKWGYIDTAGKVIVPVKYDEAGQCSEGLLSVKINDRFGFIDKTGRTVIGFEYADVQPFSEGLAAVEADNNNLGEYNFIDKTGRVVIASEYNGAGTFSEGLVAVGLADVSREEDTTAGLFIPNNLGFIDKTGRVVVQIKYHKAEPFSEGLAVVVRDNRLGFVDKFGKEVIPLRYEEEKCGCGESSFSGGIARVTLNGKVGFINNRGKEIIPVKYDDVWCEAFRNEGLIGVALNGKRGFVDLTGNEYFDF